MKIGRLMRGALYFIVKVNGWHTYAKDSSREILTLAKYGLVEVNEFSQFRITPKGTQWVNVNLRSK